MICLTNACCGQRVTAGEYSNISTTAEADMVQIKCGLSRGVDFRQGGQKIILLVMPEKYCTINYQFVILFKNSFG